jgi:hypothetical protein
LLYSRNRGRTWEPVAAGRGAAYGVRFEPTTADALMALTGGGPVRTTDGGRRFRRTTGLPASCGGRQLVTTGSGPGAFLTLCADGGVYRYVSSGADMSGYATGPDGTTPTDRPGTPDALTATPLRVLGRRTLPYADGSSGSLAFDGAVLYAANPPDGATNGSGFTWVRRVVAATGRALPDLEIPVSVIAMSYDGRRNALYLQTLGDDNLHVAMVSYDLASGRVTPMFRLPWQMGRQSLYSYDASTDRFVVADESTAEVLQIDRSGKTRARCTVSRTLDSHGAATMVAAGTGGGGYWQSEDDTTLLHIGPRCEVLARYTHRMFQEGMAENDALACDTITFGVPAVWIRDSGTPDVWAYAVPKAWCPLATGTSLAAPRAAAPGSRVEVCARVTLRGGSVPLPGATVQFTAAGHGAGAAVTDARGQACVPYPVDPADVAHGRVPVRAVFLGTASYLPSGADGAMRVALPRPELPRIHVVAPVLVVPPNVPAPGDPAPVNPPHVQADPGSQVQLQANSQFQPGGMAVPEVEQPLQVARQESTTTGLGFGAAALMAGATFAARRRNRRALAIAMATQRAAAD